MFSLIQSGISIFGWFTVNPALFAFALVFLMFGILNIIDYKRFD